MIVAVALVAASCGGDDDDGASSPAVPVEAADSSDDSSDESDASAEGDASGESDSAPPATGGGDAGSVVLGDETVAFDSARCFLQEQDAAAGGGKILFVVQAFGTDANGDELMIDVSRFDEDSQFTGDDISVVIGDPFSGSAVSWSASADLGTVQIDGSTVSADGLTFQNFDDFAELAGSFSINC